MCLVISKQICEARTPILNSTPADDVTSGAASTAAGARPLLHVSDASDQSLDYHLSTWTNLGLAASVQSSVPRYSLE